MRKIEPFSIINAHLKSLKDDTTGRASVTDIVTLYGIPLAISVALLVRGEMVSADAYTGSASVFGVFAGLLLNVQVAIFSIFLRKWEDVHDSASLDVQLSRRRIRRKILRELNANISYLIFVSACGIALSMLFYGLAQNRPIYTAIVIWVYIHIILSFLMVGKRAFLLFDAEYQRD